MIYVVMRTYQLLLVAHAQRQTLLCPPITQKLCSGMLRISAGVRRIHRGLMCITWVRLTLLLFQLRQRKCRDMQRSPMLHVYIGTIRSIRRRVGPLVVDLDTVVVQFADRAVECERATSIVIDY